jgi:heme/copper-type cytochrome/quinol oxidase subunit 3
MELPYTVEPRPDTGTNNLTLGIWLFLASEVMLFGGLFSAYVALRRSGPSWRPDDLHMAPALFNTCVLLVSGVTMARSTQALRHADLRAGRRWMLATVALGLLFLTVKGVDYAALLHDGARPATSTFFAVFFLLTGAHALHVVGGIAVILFFASQARKTSRLPLAILTNRVSATGLYWYFVDVIWLIMFAALYLL